MTLPEQSVIPAANALSGFIPIDYLRTERGIYIRLICGPKEKPQDAFISHTEQHLKHSGSQQILVPLEDRQESSSVANMAGLFFHSGRCGSTLLCNMLDALPTCFVVRESEVLNKLVHDVTLSVEDKNHLMRCVCTSYGEYARRLGARCVIKFSSHCAARLPEVLALFPELPWLYLYREPGAVMRSFLKMPAPWLAQGVSNTGNTGPNMSDRRVAIERMLQSSFEHALVAKDTTQTGQLMSYEQVVNDAESVYEKVVRHFGFNASHQQRDAMAQCLLEDAKTRMPRTPLSSPQRAHLQKTGGCQNDLGASYSRSVKDNYLRLCLYE